MHSLEASKSDGVGKNESIVTKRRRSFQFCGPGRGAESEYRKAWEIPRRPSMQRRKGTVRVHSGIHVCLEVATFLHPFSLSGCIKLDAGAKFGA